MTERWQQIERIFEDILPLPESRRQERLLELTAGDESLRREVESLLAEETEESDFLQSPVALAQDLRRTLLGEFLLGKQFGSYRIDSLIGEGGMGLVFRATDVRSGQAVALKVLPPEAARDAARRRQFDREKEAIERLRHPGIVRLLDFGIDRRFSYLVMEYVEGKTLSQVLKSQVLKSLAPDSPVTGSLIRQFVSALAAVHGAGLVHGDLKPENLMVTASHQLKLVDFGLAAQLSPAPIRATVAELGLAGTIGYSAPERIRGSAPSAASDVFAAGSVLYEMLARKPLFQGKTAWAIAERILDGRIDLSAAPARWRGVLRGCLAANPARRIPDGVALETRLRGARSMASGRRAVAVAAAVMLAFAAIWAWRRPSLEPPASLVLGDDVSPRIAVSPDRQWVAFSRPDPENHTHSHIFVRSLAGSAPVQRTTGGFRDVLPSFSDNGKTVFFESNRNPPGIYVQAGGHTEPRLAIAGGHAPRVSPDGKWIAYFPSELGAGDILAASPGIALAPLSNGFPQRWLSRESIPLGPAVWRQDSQAFTVPSASSISNVPENSSYLATFGIEQGLIARSRNEFRELCGWTGPHRLLGLAGLQGIATMQMDAIQGMGAAAILPGTPHIEACAVQGNEVFAVQSHRVTALLAGEIEPNSELKPQALHPDPRFAGASSPSLSQDGRWAAFNTEAQNGEPSIQRLLDFRTGRESIINRCLANPSGTPRISASGNAVLVHLESTDVSSYRVHSVPAMAPIGNALPVEAVAWDIAEEGHVILTASATAPRSVRANRPATGTVWTVVSSPAHNLYLPRISPDEKWLVFTAEGIADRRPRIYVAPYRSGRGTPFPEWILLGRGDYPAWSGSGNAVYYLDESLPVAELRGIELDPRTKRPRGSPVTIHTFSAEWRPSGLVPGTFRIAASRDRLLVSVGRFETKLLRAR